MTGLLSTHMKGIGIPDERIPEHCSKIQGTIIFEEDETRGIDRSIFTIISNCAFTIGNPRNPDGHSGVLEYRENELMGHVMEFNHLAIPPLRDDEHLIKPRD